MKAYRPRVGFLCHDVSPASASTLNSLSEHAQGEFALMAYPLFDTLPSGPIHFPYRPSTRRGRYISFNARSRRAPENMILNLSLTTVRALVTESDVICLLGIQGMPAFLAALLARIRDKPVVAISQTMQPEAERNRAAIIRVLKGWVLRNAAVNVAQTPPTFDTLSQVYGIPVEDIVAAPWDGGAHQFAPVLTKFEHTPKDVLRRNLAIPSSAYVIVSCGTLIYLKGVDVLIEAFSRLHQQCSDALLLVVGPDGKPKSERSALESQARVGGVSDNIRFVGQLTWEMLAQVYLASDVFVLPTRKDVWPKVLMEAALAGLPLITTSVCGGAGYLARPDENGYVVNTEDPVGLADALMALRDAERRLRMSAKSREIAEQYASISGQEVDGLRQAIAEASLGRTPQTKSGK